MSEKEKSDFQIIKECFAENKRDIQSKSVSGRIKGVMVELGALYQALGYIGFQEVMNKVDELEATGVENGFDMLTDSEMGVVTAAFVMFGALFLGTQGRLGKIVTDNVQAGLRTFNDRLSQPMIPRLPEPPPSKKS